MAVRDAAQKVDVALLEAWNARWRAYACAVNAMPFSLRTDWRFIAGLGRKGSLEVGFTFHRYGFPILTGSSVKGVTRAWALIEIAEESNKTELRQLEETLSADAEQREKYDELAAEASPQLRCLFEDFRIIFGTTAAAAGAVFFDAIPARKPRLELDIMNPHFPEYYGGDQFPTDWQNPRPVYFLTVAPGTEFCFAVGWRGTLNSALREKAEKWLKDGLMNLGAGAKTSAGYGYFAQK
jgi:CRISPR-associated protein Cmr6